MSAIYPVPVGRSSGLLMQQRLVTQLQSDQQEILRLTSQMSTGRRLLAPSDDAAAAVRGMGMQRILEQKAQVQVNLNTSRSYLAASETAVARVSNILTDVRGSALKAADSSTSATERLAISREIQAALTQLLDAGNGQFRDRFLFAGTNTTQRPFVSRDGAVVYHGNENELQSYADLDQLFSASISGAAVLGGLSAEVRGATTLAPVLSASTPLADLYGGAGVELGSLAISDGFSSRTVDLSGAKTLGDVARRLEANPPANRRVTVRYGPMGLSVELDAEGGGALSIREVGGGKTATRLGLFAPANATSTVQGEALTPRLRLTTPLDDLLGVRATARVSAAGPNNDILLEARRNGAEANGVTVQLVDDDLLQAAPGLNAGGEQAYYSAAPVAARASLALSGAGNDLLLTATAPGTQLNNVRIELSAAAGLGDSAAAAYDADSRRLTVQVDGAGQTSVASLVAAIEATGLFTVAGDNSAGEAFDLNATVAAADAGVIVGNTGNSGGDARTIFVHVDRGQTTANQVVAALQNNDDVTAMFNVRLDGKDTSASGAAGSGIVDLATTAVATGGAGEQFDRDAGLQVAVGDKTYTINFTGAETVEDLLNTLNASPAGLLAQINESGNGINIRSRVSGVDFRIGENGGTTAAQLGVRSLTRETRLAELNHGRGVHTAEGTDFLLRRSDGMELEIDISSAVTVGDVLDRINNHPDNQDPLTAVTARLTAVGNGIELVDANAVAEAPLTVVRSTLSEAALDLGLIPVGQSEAAADPATNVLIARDVNPQEAKGAFNSLLRLNAALLEGDLREISRAAEMLNEDLQRVTFARGDLGARQRNMDFLEARLQDENIELRRTLSEEIEVDLVETISNLTGRQISMEASLRQTASTLRTTLLDFL